MRMKRRNFEHRVRRLRLRASAQLPATPLEAPARHIAAPSGNVSLLVADEADGRRRAPRVRLDSEVSVRKAGSFSFQLAARDVSIGGCRVELVEMVDVAERVIVRLPALEPLGAEVAWVDGNNAGIRFQRPLHPAVFEQLIDRNAACAA